MVIDEREGGRRIEGESERDTDVKEKHQLPPVCPPTGDQACNLLLVPGTMLQPTEPPNQGRSSLVLPTVARGLISASCLVF